MDFSEVKSVFGFRVRLQNTKSRFQNLNPDFPIERNLIIGIFTSKSVCSDIKRRWCYTTSVYRVKKHGTGKMSSLWQQMSFIHTKNLRADINHHGFAQICYLAFRVCEKKAVILSPYQIYHFGWLILMAHWSASSRLRIPADNFSASYACVSPEEQASSWWPDTTSE